MEMKEAIEVCRELNCEASVDLSIDRNGTVTTFRVVFWYAKKEDVLKYRKKHRILAKKRICAGGVDLQFDNVTFMNLAKCKIVDQKTVVETVPVYECTGILSK